MFNPPLKHNLYATNNYLIKECGLSNNVNVKVLGGSIANPRSWPSLAKIDFNYKFDYVNNGITYMHAFSSICGSTVINRNTVLTSSQCLPKKVDVDISGTIYSFLIRTNNYYPTYESMFKVSAGFQGVLTNLNEKALIFRQTNVSISSFNMVRFKKN